MQYTQANRFISIETPLGQDVLLLQGCTGYEGMSRLFHWQLDLLSEEPSIPFQQIIGQRVTIAMSLADGSERYINGFVSRFAQRGRDEGFTSYYAEVVPWLWFLTRTADCRIFQNLTIPDIIAKIFNDLGFRDFTQRLEGHFEPRDYCVQYRETDFNFVCRLMEQEGIFFFFEHEKDKHTLVLANAPAVHQLCPGQPQARCHYIAGVQLGEGVVTTCQMEQELRPGKYALTDYNFETPSTILMANSVSTVKVGNNDKYEIYDYPGEYLKKDRGEQLTRLRMEEEETSHLVLQGSSTCRPFMPGYRFDLAGHASEAMNATYVLTEVQHSASVGDSYTGGEGSGGESYTNHFTCIPRDVPYRTPRTTPKPIVQGPQTAMVVGPAGEEIYTDKYGRVKVQFHWDREGQRDEHSSCWMRVSQPWAGKGWGSVSIPRLGQEVIVDFLEGDPDQPIITGRVYNAEQMPPYSLPGDGVVSGLKSNTTPGGGGYNEMSMNDTKGKEKITIHGQYDMSTTVQHDQSDTVKNNRTITVDGTHTETIKKATKITITEGTYAHDVQAGTATYHAKGAVTETYDTTQETTVKGNITIKSATGEILIDAAQMITLHTGASKLTMKSDGTIELSGKSITIVGTSDVKVTAPQAEVAGTSEVKIGVGSQNTMFNTAKVATSGAAINSSATGMHEINGAVVKIN